MILDLEVELKSERAHLREMNAGHQRAAKDREEILLQLQRTEQVLPPFLSSEKRPTNTRVRI
jgi:hypothetical protein